MREEISTLNEGPPLSGEVKLWRAVLATVVRDACSNPRHENHSASKQAIRQAQAWLGTADFREVCYLADVDPEYILTGLANGKMEELLKTNYFGTPLGT